MSQDENFFKGEFYKALRNLLSAMNTIIESTLIIEKHGFNIDLFHDFKSPVPNEQNHDSKTQ